MRRWLPASIIAGAWLFSIAVYSRLPERVPVHWGISGDADRYGSRIEGAFLMPAIMVTLFVVMQWFPSRDPRYTKGVLGKYAKLVSPASLGAVTD